MSWGDAVLNQLVPEFADCFPELFHEVLRGLEPEELDSLEEAITEGAI